jgi:hypothetical protein
VKDCTLHRLLDFEMGPRVDGVEEEVELTAFRRVSQESEAVGNSGRVRVVPSQTLVSSS